MKKIITLLFATLFATAIYAAEITYRVASYNADTDDFVLESWGEKPEGASAYFFNDYGATTGNRYNQIPRRQPTAALFLLCDRFFSIFWIKRKIISKFGEINNGNMDTQRLLKYTAAVISEFSLAHNLTLAQAFRYLKRYKGIEFVKRHYEVEHTLSFDDVVDDLTTYCKRMGGRLV